MKRPLSNHTELKEKIEALEESAKVYEVFLLREGRRALAIVSDPGPFIKQITHEVSQDKDLRKDLLRIALSAGINYLGKMISRPAADEDFLSLIFKKLDSRKSNGEGKAWKHISELLNILKPTKQEQA